MVKSYPAWVVNCRPLWQGLLHLPAVLTSAELDEAHRSAGESLADHPFAFAAITGAWAGGGRDELLDQNSGSGGRLDVV